LIKAPIAALFLFLFWENVDVHLSRHGYRNQCSVIDTSGSAGNPFGGKFFSLGNSFSYIAHWSKTKIEVKV
jgi:hypothetical protein